MVTWPEEYGGRGCDLIEWLIFEEEYYRARRAAARQPERHLPARADPDGVRHARAEGALPADGWRRARRSGRRAGPSRRRARDWRRSAPLRCATATSTCCAVRRPGPRARLRGLGLRHVPHRSRVGAAPRPHVHPGAARPARRHACAPIAQLDGETGFAEIFFDDARVPVANRLGAEGAGWQIAMATAGFERGLMLRSPARFQATAQRLVELYRRACRGARPGDRADRSRRLDGRARRMRSTPT